jgi:hypothetical protein
MWHDESDPTANPRDKEPLGAADEFDRNQGERGGERRRKERVLHTRISEALAEDLRRVADDLRVPVSNLVRNVLEEAFSVVETVTGNVGELIEEVMDEAEAVRERIQGRQRRRYRGARRDAAQAPAEEPAASTPPRDDEVIGWQPLVLVRPQRCESCGTLMGRGDSAYASVTPKGVGTSWRCEECPID